MPLAYAELLLQGQPGTTVEVSVLSARHPEPRKMTLTRAVVQPPDVTAKMMPDGVGHVQVQSMKTGAAKQIASSVKDLEKQGAKRFVLDLRHCASGDLEEGIAVANLFQDKGQIASMKGQRVPKQSWEADPSKVVTRLPLVVVTNRGTAGAAEVAAAALLENKRAEVVGERTYGNASLRQAISMDDGSAVILSVAKYYSPGGKAIQDTGVVPTVPVIAYDLPVGPDNEDDADTAPQAVESDSKEQDDLLLKRAVEVLTSGKTEVKPAPDRANAPGARSPGAGEAILTPEKPIK
jgi:carboxyl-terminal processing protease